MKLTPVTSVTRYLSINGATVVLISRCRRALDGYYDPPVVLDQQETWGSCFDSSPDSFREHGQLRDALGAIASRNQVAAAAVASPRRFAEMVGDAHRLGRAIYVGSWAIQLVAEYVRDPQRFCEIEAGPEGMDFFVLVTRNLFGEQQEPPGVYRVNYSFPDLAVRSRVLVEAWGD
ncbi:hypothetical protein J0H58_00600 [bacterium]|nr:hypothetical protein [bacterium]